MTTKLMTPKNFGSAVYQIIDNLPVILAYPSGLIKVVKENSAYLVLRFF